MSSEVHQLPSSPWEMATTLSTSTAPRAGWGCQGSGVTDALPSSASSQCLCEVTDPNRRRLRFPSPASEQGHQDLPACTRRELLPFTGPHRCSDTEESPSFLSTAFGEHIFGHMHMVSDYITPWLLTQLTRGGYKPPEEAALCSPDFSGRTKNPTAKNPTGWEGLTMTWLPSTSQNTQGQVR